MPPLPVAVISGIPYAEGDAVLVNITVGQDAILNGTGSTCAGGCYYMW